MRVSLIEVQLGAHDPKILLNVENKVYWSSHVSCVSMNKSNQCHLHKLVKQGGWHSVPLFSLGQALLCRANTVQTHLTALIKIKGQVVTCSQYQEFFLIFFLTISKVNGVAASRYPSVTSINRDQFL